MSDASIPRFVASNLLSKRPKGGRVVDAATFMNLVGEEVARAWRYDRMLSVALAKIDPMDRPVGEAAPLTVEEISLAVLDCLSANLRAPDKIGPLGPGEFGLLLPETTPRQARIATERLRDHLSLTPLRKRGIMFEVTLSIGTASLTHRVRSAEQLLLTARQEWRRARSRGGNCVAVALPPSGQTGHVRSAEMH